MTIARLMRLPGMVRLRKSAVALEAAERAIIQGEAGAAASDYAADLAQALAAAGDCPGEVRDCAERLSRQRAAPAGGPAGAPDPAILRAIHDLRHICMRVSGQAPADWDMIPPASATASGGPGGQPRDGARAGLRAYLEDIRSPFNVGAIFRTAEAFGFEELILSPDCADPGHPRAARSSMGAVAMVPWRRARLEEILPPSPGGFRPDAAANGRTGFAAGPPEPLFALELGGTPAAEFPFPERGIVVLGSEELGVSAPAISACGLGKVSIPMYGAKASINVAVAFGILAHAWRSSLAT